MISYYCSTIASTMKLFIIEMGKYYYVIIPNMEISGEIIMHKVDKVKGFSIEIIITFLHVRRPSFLPQD